MLFLLHLLGLLYGAFGLVWTSLMCTKGKVLLPASVMGSVVNLYPPSVFSPSWSANPADPEGENIPNGTKPYLISGGVFLYCLRYLFTRCRG